MFKIIGKDLGISVPGTIPSFGAQTISVIIPHNGWQPEYFDAFMKATKIEAYIEDGSSEPSATYTLVNLVSCERLWSGMRVTWHTFAPDKIDEMQDQLKSIGSQLEETLDKLAASQERVSLLTKALLDFASVYSPTPKFEQISDQTFFEQLAPGTISVNVNTGTVTSATSGNDDSAVYSTTYAAAPSVYTSGPDVATDEKKTRKRARKTAEEEEKADG